MLEKGSKYLSNFGFGLATSQKDHGDPNEGHNRHVGDLGNADSVVGRATIYLVDWLVSLQKDSDRSILNRAIVVHQDPDDLGRGGQNDSKKTGNAGQRIACGLITLN